MSKLDQICQLSQSAKLLSDVSHPDRDGVVAAVLKKISSLVEELGGDGDCCHDPHRLFIQDKLVEIGSDNIVEPVEQST